VLDTAVIQEYAIPSVYIDSIDTALAYMFIASFLDSTNTAGGTAAEIKNALGRMQWAETVIIDIRDNLGGNFNQCLDAVSHFIAAGAAIIITSDWNIDSIKVSTWLVSDATLRGTKTYLLLVNDSTAGAAELFASALKENKVATLITGVNTYGFGYKQIMAFTPDSNCVIATNGRVISLSGDTLHETGITPTDPVSVNEDALENVLEEIGGGAAQYQEAYIRISSLREKHYSRNRTFPLCFIPEN